MEYIFVSHVPQDAEIVNKISQALKRAGFFPWTDSGEDAGDESLSQQTIFTVKRSDAFLLALSNRSASSGSVLEELKLAVEAEKSIVTLLLEEVDIPAELQNYLSGAPSIDLSADFEEAMSQLEAVLAGESAAQEEARAEPVEWLAEYSQDELGGLAGLPGEEFLWSEQGYYWYKNWNTLTRAYVLLTTERLIFIWDQSDVWKWKGRESDELDEVFPIAVPLDELLTVSEVKRDRFLGILPSSRPFAVAKTRDESSHKFTLFQDFKERVDALREMIAS